MNVQESLPGALRVGGAVGSVGFLAGATAGLLRSSPPVLFGIASFIQTGVLGTSFWLVRDISGRRDVQGSATAGGIAGGLTGAVFRGPRNIIPGVICMSILGGLGQFAYDTGMPKWSFSMPKWSPMQSISDEEYAAMLKEQLLKNQVEIAILDDKIAALKREQSSSGDKAR